MSKNINFQNQDCIEFLAGVKSNSVNLVLTDPPYIISRNTNFQSGKPTSKNTDRFRVSMDFGKWDSKEGCNIDFQKICNELYRVCKKGATVIVFWDLWKIQDLSNYLTNAGFKQLRFIEWVKTNPVPINSKLNYLTDSREIAIVAVKGSKPTFHSEYDNGIYKYPIEHSKDRFHPTQKSLKLIEELIKKHSNENELVLDCFAGSATTAVACINTNRNFIGCELNTKFYEKSIQRLKNHDKKCDI